MFFSIVFCFFLVLFLEDEVLEEEEEEGLEETGRAVFSFFSFFSTTGA